MTEERTPMNPWLSVWTRPRETIRWVVQTDPNRSVLLIAALAGIVNALDRASSRNLGDKQPVEAIFIGAVLVGPVGGLISLYLGACLLRWTGRWIGGHGSPENIRAAVAWAAVPVVFSLPLWVPALMLAGREVFTSATPELDENAAAAVRLLAFGLVEVVLGVWGFVLLLKCVGEVQGFSAWKALWNVLLAGLVLLVPLTLAAVAVISLQ